MTDVFGNYVIQKFFEYGTQEQKSTLAQKVNFSYIWKNYFLEKNWLELIHFILIISDNSILNRLKHVS